MLVFFQCFIEAFAAERLVDILLAQDNQLAALAETV